MSFKDQFYHECSDAYTTDKTEERGLEIHDIINQYQKDGEEVNELKGPPNFLHIILFHLQGLIALPSCVSYRSCLCLHIVSRCGFNRQVI